MKIIQNTYPEYPNVSHGKTGDEVHWCLEHGLYKLIRDADGARVFASPPVDRDGNLRSNGKPFQVMGVVAQVKSRGWVLDVGV